MQALLLAAGQSSRMYPFANGMHKSMTKLLGKPILQHMLEKLKQKNITDIVVVVGKNSNIESYFGNGEKFGVSISYVLQENPEGAGNAILLSKKYLHDDFLLLNSYHVEIEKFVESLVLAKTNGIDGVLLVKQKENTWDYGVVDVKEGMVKAITEKPQKGKETSNLCIVGAYLLSLNFISTLENTPAEHYQLETALNSFVNDHAVRFLETKDEAVVLKYPWDILSVKNYMLSSLGKFVSQRAEIASSAEIIGNVYIEENVKIMEKVVIKGPCYIGKNVFIGNNAILRNGVDVEENSVIGANMEVKNTMIMEGAKTHSGFIGDSVIGKNCRIAAGFCTANVRLDRETVKTTVKGVKVDTGLKSLGAMIGDETHFGIKSSTMPGVIIGRNVVVGSQTTAMNNIEDNTKYYTKFQEVVEKHE
jgi:UDP-N-acetylglucosamine diphosphorylase / glucose-1-phosphate thymidylyltransferase / UDP-N-acetylgalactosamine diphosphorylase / glucosamine-1-phosphate N-acetyltransferase / galactosamine-1-phosphate N-acetyltransferase